MKYKYALFDLDGTLTDPYVGISRAVKYSLEKFDIIENRHEIFSQFIGPPLKQSFIDFYHFNEENAVKAVTFYREYYSDKGIYESELYEDIEIVLKNLKNAGINCFVTTSKLESFALQVLEHFKIDQYFIGVIGSNPDGSLSKKGDIIKIALEKYRLDKHRVVMIGDRKYDIEGAKENCIDSIAVTYGYGSKEELQKATYISETPAGLLDIIIH